MDAMHSNSPQLQQPVVAPTSSPPANTSSSFPVDARQRRGLDVQPDNRVVDGFERTTGVMEDTTSTSSPEMSLRSTYRRDRNGDLSRSGMLLPRNSPPAVASLYSSQSAKGATQFSSLLSHAANRPTAPLLESSSSNVSNSTSVDTDITSPETLPAINLASLLQQAATASSSQQSGRQENARMLPPINAALRPTTPNALVSPGRLHGASPTSPTSPMQIDTPATTHGTKRTASGTVKDHGESITSPTGWQRSNHSRNVSTESGMSRIGELSAKLKTRLSYAYVKVQNGWERNSLEEIENIQSRRGTPTSSVPSDSSPSGDASRQRVDSGTFDPYAASNLLHDATGTSFTAQPTYSREAALMTSNLVPSLAPAPDIRPSGLASSPPGHSRPRRSVAPTTRAPPFLSSASHGHSRSDQSLVMVPTTPTMALPINDFSPSSQHRGRKLPMPSQQAELDAVDSLIFMSSPNNSDYIKGQRDRMINASSRYRNAPPPTKGPSTGLGISPAPLR